MKRAVMTCLAAVLLSAAASAKTITEDNGGEIVAYWKQVQAAAHVKERIRFDGPCRSACTLFLMLPRKQVCATPRVQFWFHKPWGGTPADNQQNEQWMLATYPGWVRDWILDHGGLSKSWMIMDRYVILKHMRKC